MQLVKPSIEYKNELILFKEEIVKANDVDAFARCAGLGQYESIEEWIDSVEKKSDIHTLPEGYVPSNVYLAIENNRLVGIIDLRHHIDHPILGLWGGHIGYSVRPSERHKGIAKKMLRLNLENARKIGLEKVLVTCSENNPASRKTILSNLGVFEKIVEVNDEIIERYWIIL